ncbi:hypothetical protein Ct9H90mP29_08950 [bacterium]|nr:MAG: hypothetical protein Ct9H90mP29_08950 [bacterium]
MKGDIINNMKNPRSEFVSDSTNLDIIKRNFFDLYSFTLQKENWSSYLSMDYHLEK